MHDEPTRLHPRTTVLILSFQYILTSEYFAKLVFLEKSRTRKGPGSAATIEIYPWSFMTQIFHNGQPSRCCDRTTFEVMTNVNQPMVLHSFHRFGDSDHCYVIL